MMIPFLAKMVANVAVPKYDSQDLIISVVKICTNLTETLRQSRTYAPDLDSIDSYYLSGYVNALIIHGLDLVMPSAEIFEEAIMILEDKILSFTNFSKHFLESEFQQHSVLYKRIDLQKKIFIQNLKMENNGGLTVNESLNKTTSF